MSTTTDPTRAIAIALTGGKFEGAAKSSHVKIVDMLQKTTQETAFTTLIQVAAEAHEFTLTPEDALVVSERFSSIEKVSGKLAEEIAVIHSTATTEGSLLKAILENKYADTSSSYKEIFRLRIYGVMIIDDVMGPYISEVEKKDRGAVNSYIDEVASDDCFHVELIREIVLARDGKGVYAIDPRPLQGVKEQLDKQREAVYVINQDIENKRSATPNLSLLQQKLAEASDLEKQYEQSVQIQQQAQIDQIRRVLIELQRAIPRAYERLLARKKAKLARVS
jgi:hypothetical protein